MEGITVDPATEDIYLAIEGEQKVCRLEAPDYEDGIVFIGSQREANLWQYKLDGTMVSKISLSDFASEIAGLCYDPEGNWLWITDSNRAKLYVCTVEGELLATYDLSGIENAESVCVDRDRNCVWIGSDEEFPKLFRYSFVF